MKILEHKDIVKAARRGHGEMIADNWAQATTNFTAENLSIGQSVRSTFNLTLSTQVTLPGIWADRGAEAERIMAECIKREMYGEITDRLRGIKRLIHSGTKDEVLDKLDQLISKLS